MTIESIMAEVAPLILSANPPTVFLLLCLKNSVEYLTTNFSFLF